MNRLLSSDKLYISQSKIENAGRGVFARDFIKKGEVIETCPVIEIPENDAALLTDSILTTYFYNFSNKKKLRIVLALGFGSIYNHSYEANAYYKKKLAGQSIDFIAVKDIQKNEEITVNYNPKKRNKNPLWFE